MRSRPTALIADDEPLLRDALAAQLAQLWPELEVVRSEEHTSELQSPCNLVCRLLLEKKKFGCAVVVTARFFLISIPVLDGRTAIVYTLTDFHPCVFETVVCVAVILCSLRSF